MSQVIQHIREQVYSKNRNFVGVIVGKVGTGKSWSALRICETYNPNFDANKHVIFKVEDLLESVRKDEFKKGDIILFDEAGTAVSSLDSYMNKFNKAMSFLLQTWRFKNIALLFTVPDIKFVQNSVRKMCDALIECEKVIKRRKAVRIKWKFIQVNQQSGDIYYHNARRTGSVINIEIGKPSTKLINRYEKLKEIYITELYINIRKDIVPNSESKEKLQIKEARRCKLCGSVGDYKRTMDKWVCRKCPNMWANSLQIALCLALLHSA